MEIMLGHVIGTLFPWTTMVATVEEVCFEVIVHFIYIKRYHLAVLCNTSTTHSSVNQYSKPWFCGILRDTFRDGCQCLRTRVDYLIRLVSLITINSAANNFFRFAVAILFLLTSKHTSSIRKQRAWQPIYRAIIFSYRAIIFHLSRDILILSRDKKDVACPLWATVINCYNLLVSR